MPIRSTTSKPQPYESSSTGRTRTYVTILQRHPMLGVDRCTCGAEVTGGYLVLVMDDGRSQKVVGCWQCGGV